ncbi:MAG TPA: polysaccharide deacetylase family protein [Pedococcus sp.]|nr:polysaccharide deacetylase family protein [Pedococcus sp.]
MVDRSVPALTRRTVMALVGSAVAGIAVAGCADNQSRAAVTTSPRPLPPTPLGSGSPSPSTTSAPTKPVVPVVPGTLSTPISVRTKPVFKVHDILPNAPRNAIALTIDDGPVPYWTPKVLNVLERFNVKATFCTIGAQVHGRPWLPRAIASEGHGLANHSYRHPLDLARLPPARIEQEVARASEAIHDATGVAPKLFRSPGGNWTTEVLTISARNGLLPIDWDIDPVDWSRPGVPHITEKLLKAKPGDILLCHDGGGDRSETVAALTVVLPALKARGLEFIRI